MLTKAALIVKQPQWLRRNNSSECKIEVSLLDSRGAFAGFGVGKLSFLAIVTLIFNHLQKDDRLYFG